ncbi:MAG: cysteine hydrolase [Myxococcales bacterium]|nr:cysteine hydrolase [Myxococcales bacterium]
MNLHPNSSALLLIDLINPFDYDRAADLLSNTRSIIAPTVALADRARRASLPVIYVNDNFGRWRSHFVETLSQCERAVGAEVVQAFRPLDDDYFVLKPQRSGFFCTPLDLLLQSLNVRTLVLAGIATEMCVMATAHDACMRGYKNIVPKDTTASFTGKQRDEALDLLQAARAASVCGSEDLVF